MSYDANGACHCGGQLEWAYRPEPWAPIKYIYAVAAGDAVKFGITQSGVRERLKSLQTGNPKRLEILGVVEIQTDDPQDAPWIEKAIHDYCYRDHETGEWFKRTSPLVAGVLSAFADKERPIDAILSLTNASTDRTFTHRD